MTENALEFPSIEEAVNYANQQLLSESKENLPKALQIFQWMLDQEPDNHTVLFAVASCFMRMENFGIATALLNYALTIEPKFAEAHNNLGYMRQALGDHRGCVEHFNKAHELEPTNHQYLGNLATQFVNENRPLECIELCNQVLEMEPDNSDARWNRSLAHLELGHWVDGWSDYHHGLKTSHQSSQRRKVRHYGTEESTPYWAGTKGQSVVVYGEQGVGDEIMAASMLPDAASDANIVYECHPRLVEIMRHSFGDQFPVYGTRKVPWKELHFPKWTQIDAKCPIFELGGIYRNNFDQFPRVPYLKPFENKVEKYQDLLSRDKVLPINIGISWKGGNDSTRRELRSIPLIEWLPLFKRFEDRVRWVSLQYDPADRMGWNTPIVEAFLKDYPNTNLVHWPDVVNDLDECYGGLIHTLDLVISVNNSLVHACGAYGVNCWTLTPNRPAWRYQVTGVNPLGDDKMIWYGDHVRQIRQGFNEDGTDQSWSEILEQVGDDLETLLKEKEAA